MYTCEGRGKAHLYIRTMVNAFGPFATRSSSFVSTEIRSPSYAQRRRPTQSVTALFSVSFFFLSLVPCSPPPLPISADSPLLAFFTPSVKIARLYGGRRHCSTRIRVLGIQTRTWTLWCVQTSPLNFELCRKLFWKVYEPNLLTWQKVNEIIFFYTPIYNYHKKILYFLYNN